MRRAAFALFVAGLALVASPANTCPSGRRDVAIESAIAASAARFGLSNTVIKAVMVVESGCDPRALSPKGAMGLMQLMPGTWRELRARHALGRDPFAVHDNVMAGVSYLRGLQLRFGDLGMLAAYNAGPGRFEAYAAGGATLPAETWRYVARVRAILAQPPASDTSPVYDWRRASMFPQKLEEALEVVSPAARRVWP